MFLCTCAFMYLFFCVFVYFCVCVFAYVLVEESAGSYPTKCCCGLELFMYLCFYVLVHLCICFFVYMCISVFVFLCMYQLRKLRALIQPSAAVGSSCLSFKGWSLLLRALRVRCILYLHTSPNVCLSNLYFCIARSFIFTCQLK